MKKKLKILVLFILFLTIPNPVIAATDIKFECLDEVMVGNTVECKISLENSEQIIKGIQMNYDYDKVFSYVKTISGSNWNIASANNLGFAFLNLDGIQENSAVAQVDFLVSTDAVVPKEYEMILSNIMLSDGEKDINITNKSSKVKVLSVHDVLENITVNGVALELKDGITNYKIDIPFEVNEVSIDASLKNEKYTYIDGYGPRTVTDLVLGENEIQIKVGIEDRELITFNLILNHLNKEQVTTNNGATNNPKTGVDSFVIVGIFFIISFCILLAYKIKTKKVDQK